MDYTRILRCPNPDCLRSESRPLRGTLNLIKAKYKHGLISTGTLKCSTCNEEYPIKNGVPNLLPQRIRDGLKGKISETKLTRYDREIIDGIKWSGEMVPSYHENVVDPFISAFGARYIERYEDLYIDSVLDRYVRNKKKVVFIEIGVGTGRYLIRYGARLLNSETKPKQKTLALPLRKWRRRKLGVCKDYRRNPILRKYYSYNEDYDQNLQMLIGIDFQEGMIKRCTRNLKDMKLHSLFSKRILLLIGVAQYLNLSLDQVEELRNSYRVVTCVFQTLGNQKRQLQIDLLKTLKKLALPRGTIIVSVFNKERFFEFGLERFYKYEVAPTVGEIRDDPEAQKLIKKGILVTRRGVYSQWFSEEDLVKVFEAAGLDVKVKSHNRLEIFEDADYISKEKQDEVRKTIFIAETQV